MKKLVLFVQGGGAGAHDTWDDKLVASLRRELGASYEVRYPRMPREDDPRYGPWSREIERELARLDDRAILVGHSIGATILVHAIAERPPKRPIAGIFLVATPFVGEGGWPSEEIDTRKDLGARLPAGVPIFLYHGTSDATAPALHLDLYAKAIPQAVTRLLDDRDHQLGDDLSEVARDIIGLRAFARGGGGTAEPGSTTRARGSRARGARR